MPVTAYILTALAAYLLGSIPTGFLVAKAKGIDIRTVGSGNIGATNVFRMVGKPAGIFVLLMDGLKGFAAVAWVAPFVFSQFSPDQFWEHPGFDDIQLRSELGTQFMVLAGIFAILGHSFTCWLKFKGGKGVATGAGVFFALAPLAAGVALGTWIVVLALTRYASVASIAAAVALPVTVWLMPNGLALRLVTIAIGVFVIIKHRTNIARLRKGTEKQINFKGGTP